MTEAPIELMQIEDTLPNTISALVLNAVKDARDVVQEDIITLNMGEWLSLERHNGCQACLAGCIILIELIPTKHNTILTSMLEQEDSEDDGQGYVMLEPNDFNNNIQWKLIAIDNFRMGRFRRAIENLELTGYKHAKQSQILLAGSPELIDMQIRLQVLKRNPVLPYLDEIEKAALKFKELVDDKLDTL